VLLLLIDSGAAADLALTARVVSGAEAQQLGLVSRCYDSREGLMQGVVSLAQQIAAKSPLAVAGTKAVLLHTRCVGGCTTTSSWQEGYRNTYRSLQELKLIQGVTNLEACKPDPPSLLP